MSVTLGWADIKPNSGLDGPVYYEQCPDYLKYEMGEATRAPLFQLAFHDTIFSAFRWSEANLRAPEWMWKKDMFNLLYGTMPLWMIRSEGNRLLRAESDRLAKTFKTVCGVNRYTAFDEMMSHEFISPDRSVQRTTWEGGLSITVNFSEDKAFKLSNGVELPAASYLLDGDAEKYADLPIGKVMDGMRNWKPGRQKGPLIYNGGFEGPLAMWEKGSGENITAVEDDVHSGKRALRIEKTGKGGPYCSSDVIGKLEIGKTYEASLWMKVLKCDKVEDLPSAYLVFTQKKEGGKQPSYTAHQIVPVSEYELGKWIEYKTTVTIPENYAGRGTIYIASTSKELVSVTFLLDDIAIR